jgi:hypothetical protein
MAAWKKNSQMGPQLTAEHLVEFLLDDLNEFFVNFDVLERKIEGLRADLLQIRANARLFKCVLELKEILAEFPVEGEYLPPAIPTDGDAKTIFYVKQTYRNLWEIRAKLELVKLFLKATQSNAKLQALPPIFRLLDASVKIALPESEEGEAKSKSPRPDADKRPVSFTAGAVKKLPVVAAAGATTGSGKLAPRGAPYMAGWIRARSLKDKGKAKKAWAALEAHLLFISPHPDDHPRLCDGLAAKSSASEHVLYSIAEVTEIVYTPGKKDELVIVELRLGSKENGAYLAFEMRLEAIKWLMVLDGLCRLVAPAAQPTLVDPPSVKFGLQNFAFREPYTGGLLTVRTGLGETEEWSYFQSGVLERAAGAGQAEVSRLVWDGYCLQPTTTSGPPPAGTPPSYPYGTFDGLVVSWYADAYTMTSASGPALAERLIYHYPERQYRRLPDSPLWADERALVLPFPLGFTALATPSGAQVTIEGSVPHTVVALLVVMRRWQLRKRF